MSSPPSLRRAQKLESPKRPRKRNNDETPRSSELFNFEPHPAACLSKSGRPFFHGLGFSENCLGFPKTGGFSRKTPGPPPQKEKKTHLRLPLPPTLSTARRLSSTARAPPAGRRGCAPGSRAPGPEAEARPSLSPVIQTPTATWEKPKSRKPAGESRPGKPMYGSNRKFLVWGRIPTKQENKLPGSPGAAFFPMSFTPKSQQR